MSRRTAIDCDLCGVKDIPQPLTTVTKTNSEIKAGGCVANDYTTIDLCPPCAEAAINEHFKQRDCEHARQWTTLIATMRKQR